MSEDIVSRPDPLRTVAWLCEYRSGEEFVSHRTANVRVQGRPA